MSRIDEITGKGPRASRSRSHSNVKTNRRNLLNLQIAHVDGKRIRVSARTLKTLKKKGIVK